MKIITEQIHSSKKPKFDKAQIYITNTKQTSKMRQFQLWKVKIHLKGFKCVKVYVGVSSL